METIGKIRDRQILYVNIRADQNWSDVLSTEKWIAFTIVDDLDRNQQNKAVGQCLDKSVSYICCAGKYSSTTENLFDEEIVDRAIKAEDKTDKPYEYKYSPATTSHNNFSEGFWFATCVASDDYRNIDLVVCLDFTINGVKKYLSELIIKIGNA